MAVKVTARRLLGEALAAVAELRHDPVGRVRLAAERAPGYPHRRRSLTVHAHRGILRAA